MLDATQFEDAYMYGWYGYDLPKMNEISMACIPMSPHYYDPYRLGNIIAVIPCSDGMIYLVRAPDTMISSETKSPEYPETPKGTNGPNRP